MRSGGTSVGIIALLNTVANSTPTVAMPNAIKSGRITSGSPGLPIHMMHAPMTKIAPNAAIHGLRRPPASAIAPRTGDNTAMTRPAADVAKPHIA